MIKNDVYTNLDDFYSLTNCSFLEKGTIIVVTTVGLAAIAIGITALLGIAGHNIAPLEKLIALEPSGAWSLIGSGIAILSLEIIYLIVKGVKIYLNRWLGKDHALQIMDKLKFPEKTNLTPKSISSTRRKAHSDEPTIGRYMLVHNPCQSYSDHKDCEAKHDFVLFEIKNGETTVTIHSLKANSKEYSEYVEQHFANYTLVPTLMPPCEGIFWENVIIDKSAQTDHSDYAIDDLKKIEICKQLHRLRQEKGGGCAVIRFENMNVIAAYNPVNNRDCVYVYKRLDPAQWKKLIVLKKMGLEQL